MKAAKKAAVSVRYVLFDSWFSSSSTLHAVKSVGYDVIGMVKKKLMAYPAALKMYAVQDTGSFRMIHNRIKKDGVISAVMPFFVAVCAI